jgi:hypothetical protein
MNAPSHDTPQIESDAVQLDFHFMDANSRPTRRPTMEVAVDRASRQVIWTRLRHDKEPNGE